MNQSFKKKVVAASVAMAFMGAHAASANQFASSAIADPTKVTVNTATTLTASRVGNGTTKLVIQELGQSGMADGYVTFKIPSSVRLSDTTPADISTSSLGTSAAPVGIYLDGSSRLRITSRSGSIISTAVTLGGGAKHGVYSTLAAATGSDSADVKVGQIYFDSATNETVITLALVGASTSVDSWQLDGFYLKPAAANSAGTVALTFADGKADGTVKTGATDDSSVPVMTLVAQAASVTGTASTSVVPTVTAGAVAAQPIGVIRITSVGGTNATTADTLTIALDNGAKFHTGAAATVQAITTLSNNGTVNTALKTGTGVTVDSQGRLVLNTGTNALSDQEYIEIPVNTAVIDASAVAGGATIKATVTGSDDFATINQSVDVATSATRSVTVSWVDDATTGYKKLYAGRTGQTISDLIRIAENAPASLVEQGAITLTLDQGAKFTASDTITATRFTDTTYTDTNLTISNITTATTAANAASTSVTADSIGARGAYSFGGSGDISLDLTSGTVGDLTVTVSGTAGASGTAKIAEITNATSASVSGTLPTMIPAGATVTLPDIVITESNYGALNVGVMGLKLPAGVTFDTVAPTITVKGSAGTALASKVTTPATSHIVANAAGTAASTYEIGITAASDVGSGPYTITVSGLKVKASSSASAGDVTVTIHGITNATVGDATVATSADETTSASNVGAMPTKQDVKVATLVSASNPAYPTVTVSDSTKAVISGVPLTAAGNDQGKPGSIYVAFIFGDQVFFMNSSQQWAAYSGTSPAAYFTGNLSTTNIDVLKTATDLSSLKGGYLVIGYGLGLAGLSNPFDEMLRNSRYNVIYTVQ